MNRREWEDWKMRNWEWWDPTIGILVLSALAVLVIVAVLTAIALLR